MNATGPTALIILDGFGYCPDTQHNAIAAAHTPHFDSWLREYPHTIIKASGNAVGLPQGYIGNSEVGHLTIGAGRVVPQAVWVLSRAIDDGSFFTNTTIVDNLEKLKKDGGALHVMGLLSDAGVHSHEKHIHAFLQAAHEHGIKDIYFHAFLDGRDVPPKSAQKYLQNLEPVLKKYTAKLGSIHGRFYAMDRDKNWERTKYSYDVLTQAQETVEPWREALERSYREGETDEFFVPIQVDRNAIIKKGDGVIFANFRADRARQLTAAFADPSFDAFPVAHHELSFFLTAADYNSHLNVEPLYIAPPTHHTLKDTLATVGKSIFSIAETEKYAHVTYFFNGGREKKVPGETWTLIPSIARKDYVEKPHMSAQEITDAVLASLQHKPKDFYLINYANADMVGHSGNMQATVKAVEFLDKQLQKLYEEIVIKQNGTMYITGDHGNAESMFDPASQQPRTAHTTNPVYFLVLNKQQKNSNATLKLKQLCDIAPYILKQMNIAVPDEMQAPLSFENYQLH